MNKHAMDGWSTNIYISHQCACKLIEDFCGFSAATRLCVRDMALSLCSFFFNVEEGEYRLVVDEDDPAVMATAAVWRSFSFNNVLFSAQTMAESCGTSLGVPEMTTERLFRADLDLTRVCGMF